MRESCYKCHSSGSEKVKGGLLLDTKEGILKGGDTGPAIVPGDAEGSLLIKAVRYTDKDLQMPPKNKRLPENQIADLIAWVKMGAPDPRATSGPISGIAAPKPAYDFAAARLQWAFHAPEDPPAPPVKKQTTGQNNLSTTSFWPNWRKRNPNRLLIGRPSGS